MTIINSIRKLYKNPGTQALFRFHTSDALHRVLSADNTRRYLRLQSIHGAVTHIFFGNKPLSGTDLRAGAGARLDANSTGVGDTLEISGEGIWKGEVWATASNVGSILHVLAYGNQPHPWPGQK